MSSSHLVGDVPEPPPQPQIQLPQASPRVTVNVRQLTIPGGESRTVDCTPEGSPLPRVQWSKGEGEFSNSVRQDGTKLTITDAQDGDAGDYVCTGIVQATPVWTDYLQVVIEDVEPVTEPGPSDQSPPKVKVGESQVKVTEGETKTIDCHPEGYPLPTVQWTKEEGQFTSGTRQEGNSLVISVAKEDDTGYYTCSAIVDGTAVYTDYLTVELESNGNKTGMCLLISGL
ncbi:basement membrane-specific heparan sulfate proteoglycan core protein-like [Cydia amplana]|uniref:basement membrane-specific heparan sulfate proteoglycan core protein-like n=1 Tax=Cydia amplana TaxID=1869771 RepID=UPI002FE564A0